VLGPSQVPPFDLATTRRYPELGVLSLLAQAVLTVLEARRLRLSDDQRATVLACTDPDTLAIWLQRAATATVTDELFVT
jgi:hypothetical protein